MQSFAVSFQVKCESQYCKAIYKMISDFQLYPSDKLEATFTIDLSYGDRQSSRSQDRAEMSEQGFIFKYLWPGVAMGKRSPHVYFGPRKVRVLTVNVGFSSETMF